MTPDPAVEQRQTVCDRMCPSTPTHHFVLLFFHQLSIFVKDMVYGVWNALLRAMRVRECGIRKDWKSFSCYVSPWLFSFRQRCVWWTVVPMAYASAVCVTARRAGQVQNVSRGTVTHAASTTASAARASVTATRAGRVNTAPSVSHGDTCRTPTQSWQKGTQTAEGSRQRATHQWISKLVFPWNRLALERFYGYFSNCRDLYFVLRLYHPPFIYFF